MDNTKIQVVAMDKIVNLDGYAWSLVLSGAHHSGGIVAGLSAEQAEDLHAAMWLCTDAYGEPGHIPPQGMDWSGFRDSSDKAIRNAALVVLGKLTEFGRLDLIPGVVR